MLENQIRELEGGLPITEEEKLSRSLEDTREMLRRFEEIMAQTQQNQQDSERASAQQEGTQSMQQRVTSNRMKTTESSNDSRKDRNRCKTNSRGEEVVETEITLYECRDLSKSSAR